MKLSLSSMLLRIGSFVWLSACISVLVFGYTNRQIHDMPVAFYWLIGLLALPMGTAAMIAVGVGMGVLSMVLELEYHPFWDDLPAWLVAVAVGYWQWFVFVPRQVRESKVKRQE